MQELNSSSNKTFKRLDYIDICKGLGMLLIMWGHVVEYGISHNFVYAFHIPLYFALSGMVFSKDKYPNIKTFLIKKTKSLLIPYVVFSVLTWMAWATMVIIQGEDINSIWMPLAETVIAQGSGGFLVHNVPLWFVTCLFIVELMYYYVCKLPNWANLFVCTLAMIVGVWMQKTTLFDFKLLPWNIEVALAAIIFFALGHLIIQRVSSEKYIALVKRFKIATFMLLILGFSIVYLVATYNGKVSMGSCRLSNPYLFYLGAVFGSISMIAMCTLISLIKDNPISRFIKWFGQNSFNAMAIHNPIKGIVVMFVVVLLQASKKQVQSVTSYGFIAFVLLFIATVLSMILINKLTNCKRK